MRKFINLSNNKLIFRKYKKNWTNKAQNIRAIKDLLIISKQAFKNYLRGETILSNWLIERFKNTTGNLTSSRSPIPHAERPEKPEQGS